MNNIAAPLPYFASRRPPGKQVIPRDLRTAFKLILTAWLLSCPLQGAAADLLTAYRKATVNDARWRSAGAAFRASMEKLPQGFALLMPTVDVKASVVRTEGEIEYLGTTPFVGGNRGYRTEIYRVDVVQPLYNRENSSLYDKAKASAGAATANYRAAQADLMQRVVQAYFELLLAQVYLDLATSQKTSFASQLNEARERYVAGVVTLADVLETQAKYDLSVSQELSARNDLALKRDALRRIIGPVPNVLSDLLPKFPMLPPQPANVEQWVELAEQKNPRIETQRFLAEEARQERHRARGAHLPVVEAVVSYVNSRDTGSEFTDVGSHSRLWYYGLRVQMPIFQGGNLNSKSREAWANEEKGREDLEDVRKEVEFEIRRAFLAVLYNAAQVAATEQGLSSAELQLESRREGFKAGTRTMTDVLNAEQLVYAAKKDLAQARYTYCVESFRLQMAAGEATESTLARLNDLLTIAARPQR